MSIRLDPRRISGAVVLAALAEGWRQLRGCLKPAAGFAAVFVLIGVLANTPEGNSATLFYLVAYTFMAAGSFAVRSVRRAMRLGTAASSTM